MLMKNWRYFCNPHNGKEFAYCPKCPIMRANGSNMLEYILEEDTVKAYDVIIGNDTKNDILLNKRTNGYNNQDDVI